MRISELTGYKTYPEYKKLTQNPSFNEFVKLATEQGWIFYGKGFNGAVLRHPNKNWVYKIFSDAGHEGSSYYGYALWAAKHQNNPFVPRVGKPIKIPGTAHRDTMWPAQRSDHNLYLVRSEILSPANGKNDPRFEKYIDKRYDRSKTSDYHLDRGEELSLWDHVRPSLYLFNKDYREVWEFAQEQLDLGINNVMFRGNQLVITDPMA